MIDNIIRRHPCCKSCGIDKYGRLVVNFPIGVFKAGQRHTVFHEKTPVSEVLAKLDEIWTINNHP